MKPHRIPSLVEEQARIDAARAVFTKGVEVLEPFQFKPPPERRDWIDPETVLNRKRRRLRPAESQLVRQITEAL